MTVKDRDRLLREARLSIAEYAWLIRGYEAMMRDGVIGPTDIEHLRVGLWRMRLAERVLLEYPLLEE
jgi:hypothetical protein